MILSVEHSKYKIRLSLDELLAHNVIVRLKVLSGRDYEIDIVRLYSNFMSVIITYIQNNLGAP